MSQFPEPIPLPFYVHEEREQRQKHILVSAYYGIGIRTAIILFELVGVLIFGSASLLMDAVSSLIDVASSILLIISIKLAARPPDTNHPFGHGRFEPLVGLQLGLMLIVVGAGMLLYQSFHLMNESTLVPLNTHTWIFPCIATVLLEVCYQIVMYTAKVRHSPALKVDAIHYRIDSLTSLSATLALLVGSFNPELSLTFDYLGAILIAVLMIGLGVYSAKNNLDQLIDRVPQQAFFDIVKIAAQSVKGVFDTEKIRIQLYGPDAHVDIDIEVDPELSVKLAHEISQKVRAEIQKKWPAVRDVTVHVEPYYPNDHV